MVEALAAEVDGGAGMNLFFLSGEGRCLTQKVVGSLPQEAVELGIDLAIEVERRWIEQMLAQRTEQRICEGPVSRVCKTNAMTRRAGLVPHSFSAVSEAGRQSAIPPVELVDEAAEFLSRGQAVPVRAVSSSFTAQAGTVRPAAVSGLAAAPKAASGAPSSSPGSADGVAAYNPMQAYPGGRWK